MAGFGKFAPPAAKRVITPSDLLQQTAYGDAWPEVRQALIDAPQVSHKPFQVEYIGQRQAENLDTPITVMSGQDKNTYDPASRTIKLNRSGSERLGVSPLTSLLHEAGHAAQQVKAPDAALYPHRGVVENLTRNAIESQGMPDPLYANGESLHFQVPHHAGYMTRIAELLADLGHAKKLHYGVTGKVALTPEDNYNLLMGWLNEKPKVNPQPSGVFNAYGPDPIMQYGPKAGNPAEKFEFLKGMFQHIIPKDLPENRIRRIVELMGTTAQNSEPDEAIYG